MIDKIGIKTTVKELVAYKILAPGADDVMETARFNGQVHKAGGRPKDPIMVLYHDPKDDPGCKKEVLIPIDEKVDGLDIKEMDEMKVAFLLYNGSHHPIEYYYEKLNEYIKEQGLKPASDMCSIEAVYQPDEFNLSYGSFIDEDNPETWKTEIMIPIAE
jgi:effector-binding domain-containing protein